MSNGTNPPTDSRRPDELTAEPGTGDGAARPRRARGPESPRWRATLGAALAVLAVLAGALVAASTPATAQTQGDSQVRIAARKLDNGKIEFALQQRSGNTWGQYRLPRSRFFPTDKAAMNSWLNSSPLTVRGPNGVMTVRISARKVPNDRVEWRFPPLTGQVDKVGVVPSV